MDLVWRKLQIFSESVNILNIPTIFDRRNEEFVAIGQ